MAYKDLSLAERHAIIRESVARGIHRLSDIEAMYDASYVAPEQQITVAPTEVVHQTDMVDAQANVFSEGGGIHISPSKRGTFTAAATKHGKSVQAFASQVLAHKENYSPAMVRKANFARNAAHWHSGTAPGESSYLERDVVQDYTPQIIEPIQLSDDVYKQLRHEQILANQGVFRDADIQRARESGFSLPNIKESSRAKEIQRKLDAQGSAVLKDNAAKTFSGIMSMALPSTYIDLGLTLYDKPTLNPTVAGAIDLGSMLLTGFGPSIAKKGIQKVALNNAIRKFNKDISSSVPPHVAWQNIEVSPNFMYHREASIMRPYSRWNGSRYVINHGRVGKGQTISENGVLKSVNNSSYPGQDLIWWDKGGNNVTNGAYTIRVSQSNNSFVPVQKAESAGFKLRAHQNYEPTYFVTESVNTPVDDIITFRRNVITGDLEPYSTNRVLNNKMSIEEMFQTPTVSKSNAASPLMSSFDFSDSNTKDIVNQMVQHNYRTLLSSGKGFVEGVIPAEDLGRTVKGFPNSTLQEFENTVFPRMVAERPWMQPEEFLQNARTRIGNEYSVYPKNTFEKAFPGENVKGTYWPHTDRIAVEQGAEDYALSHEVRHKLDKGIELTQNEEDILYSAFGKDFDELASKFSTESMQDEMVTTNLDARRKLIGDTHITRASVAQQNKIIDAMPDERVIKAIKESNGYGKALIEKLDKEGKLTEERIQSFREAMKKVGIAATPATIGTMSLNSTKKSTGGPFYPFSFSKQPLPAVRYANGGKKIIPSKTQIVQAAWANENPTNRGFQRNGLWGQYDDPKGNGLKNAGPGLLVGATIPNKKEYTKQELDNAAYTFGLEGLASIGDSYNEKYGTKAFPTPFDTVSVAPKLLMLDTRYQNGRLPIGSWPALYQAVADGNWAEAIKQSRSTYVTDDGVKHYDNDRVRRRAESIFPEMFDVSFIADSPIYPIVKKR